MDSWSLLDRSNSPIQLILTGIVMVVMVPLIALIASGELRLDQGR